MILILEIFSQNFMNFLSLDKKLIFSNQIDPSSFFNCSLLMYTC